MITSFVFVFSFVLYDYAFCLEQVDDHQLFRPPEIRPVRWSDVFLKSPIFETKFGGVRHPDQHCYHLRGKETLPPDLMAFVDLGSTTLPTGSPGTVCFPIPVVIC